MRMLAHVMSRSTANKLSKRSEWLTTRADLRQKSLKTALNGLTDDPFWPQKDFKGP